MYVSALMKYLGSDMELNAWMAVMFKITLFVIIALCIMMFNSFNKENNDEEKFNTVHSQLTVYRRMR
jgi:heme/copper-type cytochrome/quinol oxidase subunit 2